MALGPVDEERLREALQLAGQALGLSEPNPRVGCVIGFESESGGDTGAERVVGRGHTQAAGDAHAEVMALRDARDSGLSTRGATAWVTLEPCAHHGRTPPCCDALIEAGIARVVVAVGDPFPSVDGLGIARLRGAGVAVDIADGEVALAARELNIGFFSRVRRGRPWVRMKIAASLDGRTALADGTSQWITGEPARADGHAWRKRAGAVLTGIGTVLEDDPRLDVRHLPTPRQPVRVVVDSRLQTPRAARVVAPPGEVWIYAGDVSGAAAAAAALAAAGADIRALPEAGGKVDLEAMLADLATRGINELHVEAGHKLNASFLRADLVDELLIYIAPMLIGPGRELAALPPLARLADAARWRFVDVHPVGADLRLRLRPLGREVF